MSRADVQRLQDIVGACDELEPVVAALVWTYATVEAPRLSAQVKGALERLSP